MCFVSQSLRTTEIDHKEYNILELNENHIGIHRSVLLKRKRGWRNEKHLQYSLKHFILLLFYWLLLLPFFLDWRTWQVLVFFATKQKNRKVLSINYTHDTLIAHRNRTKMAKKTETNGKKGKAKKFNLSILSQINQYGTESECVSFIW